MKEILDKKFEIIETKMVEMIPDYMRDAISLWLWEGIYPGSFLGSVIECDFKGACLNADQTNSAALANYGKFFTWYMPSGCWGSKEVAEAWEDSGGWNGMLKSEFKPSHGELESDEGEL